MTTTVRSVRVELEMGIAGYIANARLAGRETEAAFSRVEGQILRINRGVGTLDKSTAGLARTSAETRVQQTQLGREIDKTGTSAGRAEKSIDKYSGRLRVLLETAVTLGPALIPLGAATIPALTGALAGLGAAAGGIGVAILAFNGVGGALKAIDAARLEPTAENLQAMRVELEKLGPAGAEFATYLYKLRPVLSDLQNTARAGIFPGVEDGIDDLLTRLPQVQRIIEDLSQGMGDLAREAGQGLASDRFSAFFDYVESDARPTLEAFGHSIGNVAEGVANMIVAFAPLSRDFTSGLEDATRAFADWSEGLSDSQGFNEFVGYIRRSGPQAVEFLGAIAQAFASIIEAAAPFGSAVLPALTQLARLFTAIAKSPIGEPLFTAAAGLVAFNRAAKITGGLTDSVTAGLTRLGIEAATTQSKIALLGTGGAAAALGIGTLLDGFNQLDSMSRSKETVDATVASFQDLQDTLSYSNVGKYADDLHINLARLTQDLSENGEQGEYVQRVLKQLGDESHGAGAAFGALAGNILPFYTASADKAYDANKDLKTVIQSMGGPITQQGGFLHWVASAMGGAAAAADDLSGALARLNGWFDKRQAVRDYHDAITQLGEALKNGFQPKDQEVLDNLGRSILQVVRLLPKGQQAGFLEAARANLAAIAQTYGPKAAAAIQEVIDKFDSKGLTHPPPTHVTIDSSEAEKKIAMSKLGLRELHTMQARPHIGADSSEAERKGNAVKVLMRQLAAAHADPKVTVDPGNSMGILGMIRSALGSLHDRSITVTTTQINRLPQQVATGGYITGPGGPTDDRIPAMLSNGEYVMRAAAVQKYGLKAMSSMNALRLADGGPVRRSSGGTTNPFSDAYQPFHLVADAATEAAHGLKALKRESHELEKQQSRLEKKIDKFEAKRDAVQSRYDDISSTVVGNLQSDIFAPSEEPKNPWAQGARPGGVIDPIGALERDIANTTAYNDLRGQLQNRGLTGSALEAVSRQGTDALAQVAGYSDADLARFQQLYTQREQMTAAAGGAAANAVVGEQLAGANDRLDRANDRLDRVVDRLHEVEKAIHQANNDNKKAHHDGVAQFTQGVNNAAGKGKDNRVYGGRR